jgi:hypothetical protein
MKQSAEREQQFVFFSKLVGKFEAIGDELCGAAVALGRYPLNSL